MNREILSFLVALGVCLSGWAPAGAQNLSVYPTGQAHDSGGSLESYSTLVNPTLWNGVKLPFGGNVVFPMARGRVELFGGIGGVYVSFPFQSPYARLNSWVTQAKFGTRVALDREHRFWIGATTHYQTNFADKTRQWGYGSADFTIRFGH
jgi:hypothetical protein